MCSVYMRKTALLLASGSFAADSHLCPWTSLGGFRLPNLLKSGPLATKNQLCPWQDITLTGDGLVNNSAVNASITLVGLWGYIFSHSVVAAGLGYRPYSYCRVVNIQYTFNPYKSCRLRVHTLLSRSAML